MRITAAEARARQRAVDLARELRIALTDCRETLAPGEARLVVKSDSMELRLPEFAGALSVDFASPGALHRLRAGRREPLLRACGINRGGKQVVVDATGGLGTDAWLLANAGAQLVVLERHPLVFALLREAHRRGAERADLVDAVGRMRLVLADACEHLARLDAIDVIYLDPMFPPRRKSALVKQPMRMLKLLVGEDGGEASGSDLFAAALEARPSRIVVKRPLHMNADAQARVPTFTLKGRSVRFDVYELS